MYNKCYVALIQQKIRDIFPVMSKSAELMVDEQKPGRERLLPGWPIRDDGVTS
jgi:hypothetical protein